MIRKSPIRELYSYGRRKVVEIKGLLEIFGDLHVSSKVLILDLHKRRKFWLYWESQVLENLFWI